MKIKNTIIGAILWFAVSSLFAQEFHPCVTNAAMLIRLPGTEGTSELLSNITILGATNSGISTVTNDPFGHNLFYTGSGIFGSYCTNDDGLTVTVNLSETSDVPVNIGWAYADCFDGSSDSLDIIVPAYSVTHTVRVIVRCPPCKLYLCVDGAEEAPQAPPQCKFSPFDLPLGRLWAINLSPE